MIQSWSTLRWYCDICEMELDFRCRQLLDEALTGDKEAKKKLDILLEKRLRGLK
jgi:hypothetical protein